MQQFLTDTTERQTSYDGQPPAADDDQLGVALLRHPSDGFCRITYQHFGSHLISSIAQGPADFLQQLFAVFLRFDIRPLRCICIGDEFKTIVVVGNRRYYMNHLQFDFAFLGLKNRLTNSTAFREDLEPSTPRMMFMAHLLAAS